MWSWSPSNSGLAPITLLATASATSRIGSPNATTGIATATIVVAFCEPASASALSMNPTNRLPESPRKIDAGFELYRRNPRIAPASTIVIIDTIAFPLSNEITNITIVEKNAEPAASPSNPSIKLNAFVISSTQNIVSGRQYTHSSALPP